MGNFDFRYSENIDYSMLIYFNSNVQAVKFTFSEFETEYYYDTLTFSGATITNLSGYYSPNTQVEISPSSIHTIQLDFFSDYSIIYHGVGINNIAVKCHPTPQTPTHMYLFHNFRYDGILFGTFDVNYYIVEHKANFETNIIVHGYDDADIDLYVKQGSYPTSTNYFKKSISTYGDEAIRLTTSNPTGWYYVAVPSYSGMGQYSIRVAYTKPNERHILTVGTNFNATQSQMNLIYDNTEKGIKRIYGATMGSIYVYEAHIYNSGGCYCGGSPCDVCWHSGSGRAYCENWNKIHLFVNDDLEYPQTLAHEWGHCELSLNDEYHDVGNPPHSNTYCGHSLMARSLLNNALCYSGDHGKDGDDPCPSNLIPAWTSLGNQNRIYGEPWKTPDGETFENMNFPPEFITIFTHY